MSKSVSPSSRHSPHQAGPGLSLATSDDSGIARPLSSAGAGSEPEPQPEPQSRPESGCETSGPRGSPVGEEQSKQEFATTGSSGQ